MNRDIKKLIKGELVKRRGSDNVEKTSQHFNQQFQWICNWGILAFSLLIQLFISLAIIVTSQILFHQLCKINIFQKSGFNNLRELV